MRYAGGQCSNVRMTGFTLEIYWTFTGTIECLVDVWCDNPFPAEFTEINAQWITATTILFVALFAVVRDYGTFAALLTHVSC